MQYDIKNAGCVRLWHNTWHNPGTLIPPEGHKFNSQIWTWRENITRDINYISLKACLPFDLYICWFMYLSVPKSLLALTARKGQIIFTITHTLWESDKNKGGRERENGNKEELITVSNGIWGVDRAYLYKHLHKQAPWCFAVSRTAHSHFPSLSLTLFLIVCFSRLLLCQFFILLSPSALQTLI